MTTDAQLQGYVQQIASADVPDVTDTSYQAQVAALGDYAQSAFNEVLAQYRFMGLLAGIKGPNDTDEDVTNARNGIMEALGEFFQAGPLSQQVAAKAAEIQAQHAALEERVMDMLRSGEYDPASYLAAQNILDTVGNEHPHNISEGKLEGIARGNMAEHWASRITQVPANMQADFAKLVALQTQVASLEDARRAARQQAIVDWFKGIWDGIKTYYDENMALIRNGQWLLATGRIAIDVAVFAAEEIVVAAIVAAVIGLTGGVAAGMALALRGAVRMALSVVRQGTRTVRRVNATWDFKIELRKIEPGILYSNPIPINFTATRKLDYEHNVNVQTDLTPDERLALGEGGQGSTRPDADAPESGGAGRSGELNTDDTPYSHPRDGDLPRPRSALLRNGRVPGRNQFRNWFNDLSPDELDDLWNYRDPTSNQPIYRNAIRQRLLNGGGHHEWLMRSRAPHLKRLGFTSDDIMEFVDATDDLSGPIPGRLGERWRHNPEEGGRGPGPDGPTMHASLGSLIDSSQSRGDLLRKLGAWSEDWLDNGIDSFQPNLQQAIREAGG